MNDSFLGMSKHDSSAKARFYSGVISRKTFREHKFKFSSGILSHKLGVEQVLLRKRFTRLAPRSSGDLHSADVISNSSK